MVLLRNRHGHPSRQGATLDHVRLNEAGFDPSRFLSPAPERHRYAWIPFGGGKRGCVGAGFARQEAVLVLARLCRHYRLDLADPALPRPRGFATLRPAGPVRMRLVRRG